MVSFSFEVVDLIDYSERLYFEGHLVERWASGISRELEEAIRFEAPLNRRPNKNRTAPPRGTLKAGISVDEPRQVGPRSLEFDVRSSASYTQYVVNGTGMIIVRGEGGRFGRGKMLLPAQPGLPRRKVSRVRGQEANDFFFRGYDAVAVRHSALG